MGILQQKNVKSQVNTEIYFHHKKNVIKPQRTAGYPRQNRMLHRLKRIQS